METEVSRGACEGVGGEGVDAVDRVKPGAELPDDVGRPGATRLPDEAQAAGYNFFPTRFSSSELVTTETEEKAMARPANSGLRVIPRG